MGGDDNDLNLWTKTKLNGDGSFRSNECIEILKEIDIVITNPPFSLFREYVAQLMEYNKSFIIWGNMNAVTYKEIFPLLKDNKMWLGYIMNKTCIFRLPNHYEKYDEKITNDINDGNKYGKVPSITTFTNLDIDKKHEPIILQEKYNEEKYTKYDNYDIINVNKISQIPSDYYGIMGVPITFLGKYNPEQFEILGSQRWCKDKILEKLYYGEKEDVYKENKTLINGKETYDRIFIRRKDITKN